MRAMQRQAAAVKAPKGTQVYVSTPDGMVRGAIARPSFRMAGRCYVSVEGVAPYVDIERVRVRAPHVEGEGEEA